MKTGYLRMEHEPLSQRCWWRCKSSIVRAIFVAFLGLGAVGPAHSLEFSLGDVKVDLDSTLSYALSTRVPNQNSKLLADPNGDDGNRSFDQWDLITNRVKIGSEVDLQYKNVGIFVRGRAWKDFAYSGDNRHDSPLTNNNGPQYGGPLTKNDGFSDKIKDEYETKAEFLDYFAYGDWEIGGHYLSLRVGSQVVSWGESLLLTGGISSAQGHVDAREANKPGMELKDLFLPSEQVYGQIELFGGLTLVAYYQWEWEKIRFDEAGTYFNTLDFFDENAHRILVAPGLPASIDRISDDYAKDSGQWGVSLRYLANWLNDTEFGLYYINYHDKGPQVIVQPGGGTASVDWATFGPSIGLPPSAWGGLAFADTSSYFFRYAEDIQLYGLSFGTAIGDTNVCGEVSFRRDFPVAVKDPMNPMGDGYEDGDVLQAQVSILHSLSPTFLWDDAMLMAEVGWNRVSDVTAELVNDRSAWGYIVQLSLSYLEILPNLDLVVPLTFKHYPKGVSSVPGTFEEDANSASVGFNFLYKQRWVLDVAYVDFLGDAEDNAFSDRDYVSAILKYSF